MEEKKMTPQERYKKKYAKQYCLSLVTTTDSDIIKKLDSVENRNGYIKALIRADIAANGIGSDESSELV